MELLEQFRIAITEIKESYDLILLLNGLFLLSSIMRLALYKLFVRSTPQSESKKRIMRQCEKLVARSRQDSQFQKLSFNNLLASSPAEGELLIVSCRLSPAVSGRLAAGGLWHEPEYFDAVAVINTGNCESIIYQYGEKSSRDKSWLYIQDCTRGQFGRRSVFYTA